MEATGLRWLVTTGGRDFNDYDFVRRHLDQVVVDYAIEAIAQGGAGGADFLVRKWCFEHKNWLRTYRTFPADWQKHGKRAGPLRNIEMLDTVKPVLVYAFPGGRGTQHCMNEATKRKISVIWSNVW